MQNFWQGPCCYWLTIRPDKSPACVIRWLYGAETPTTSLSPVHTRPSKSSQLTSSHVSWRWDEEQMRKTPQGDQNCQPDDAALHHRFLQEIKLYTWHPKVIRSLTRNGDFIFFYFFDSGDLNVLDWTYESGLLKAKGRCEPLWTSFITMKTFTREHFSTLL